MDTLIRYTFFWSITAMVVATLVKLTVQTFGG